MNEIVNRNPATDAALDALRASLDITTIISGRGIELKRQGAEHVGLCPFHDDTTASLSVNGKKGVYYCRACEATGDAIGFLMHFESRSFGDVVHELSNGAIDLRRDGDQVSATYSRPLPRRISVAAHEPKVIQPVPAGAGDIVAKITGFDSLTAKEPKSVEILNPGTMSARSSTRPLPRSMPIAMARGSCWAGCCAMNGWWMV